MKRALLVGLFALCGCASDAHEPSGTLNTSVTGRHISDISRDVQQWHDMQNPSCLFNRVINAQVVKDEKESTVEHWTIEACKGESFTYRVLIMPYPNGGIGDMVSNLDGGPVAPQPR